jgi:hypothetical protein
MMIFLIKWWSVFALIALSLIFFRDDRDEIVSDLNGVKSITWYFTLLNCILVYVILPFTIPYSFSRILNKWIK